MPIHAKCPVCGHAVVAPDGSAGRRGRCPSCKVMIRLPTAEQLAARAARPDQAEVPPQREGETAAPPNDTGEMEGEDS